MVRGLRPLSLRLRPRLSLCQRLRRRWQRPNFAPRSRNGGWAAAVNPDQPPPRFAYTGRKASEKDTDLKSICLCLINGGQWGANFRIRLADSGRIFEQLAAFR